MWSLLLFCVFFFFFQEDLVHTIGESVALGAAGIVLWGDALYSTNKVKYTKYF